VIGHRTVSVLVRSVLATVTVVTALVVGATPTQAAYPGESGRLVFSSDRGPGAGYNLFTSDLDGSNLVQLTFGSRFDIDAVWSPGGQRIAFTRYTTSAFSDGEIYVINEDGSDLTRVTNDPADDYRPTWSPDANLIAFTSNRIGDNYDIYTTTPDGATRRRVTFQDAWDLEPSWNPHDLNLIMFSRWRATETPELATVSVGSRQVHCCETTPNSSQYDIYPDWAPDGQSYTWMRLICGASTCDSRVMSRIGATAHEIAAAPGGVDEYPGWAPDGGRIYYDTNSTDPDQSDSQPVLDIFSVSPTGGDNTAVTSNTSSFSYQVDVQPLPDFPLVDARFSTFEAAIVWVFENGITTGCDAERYCDKAGVTRGQMAAFLTRAIKMPPATQDWFTDDETSTFEASINAVREAEIAFGCTMTTFCPNQVVTRGQMAAFLDRALDLPPATQDWFTDDETSTFEASINRVREANIATGCTATTYCPNQAVTRGQMAAFLYRALAP